MIGVFEPGLEEVTVMGGGISGLLAAFRLIRQGRRVHLIEKSNRLGGLIQTKRENGYLFEGAAHSLLVTKEIQEFFKEIQLEMEPLQKHGRARWIFRGGKARRFPLSFPEVLSMFARMTFVAGEGKSLDLQSWACKHLGKGVLEGLIYPMTQGIHGCEPALLDQETAFPRLKIFPGDTLLSSLFRRKKTPKASMQAPRFGMQSLVEKCVLWLEASGHFRVSLETEVESLPTGPLVLAVPAGVAATYLEGPAKELLERIKYNALSVFSFAFEKAKKPPQGIGMLMARGEKLSCSGILYPSSSFKGRGPNACHTVSVFVPGCEKGIEQVGAEIHALFQVEGPFMATHTWRWPQAIPRYDKALREAVQGLPALLPSNCVLVGNYTGTLSLRQMIEEALMPLPAR